jgi:hypothetical protein
MIDLNVLDVLKKRETKTLPPHFAKIKVSDVDFGTQETYRWIKSKLSGRYFFNRHPYISENNQLKSATFAAFEDHKELTYFMLACPYLRRTK